jgi:hypothetical protein
MDKNEREASPELPSFYKVVLQGLKSEEIQYLKDPYIVFLALPKVFTVEELQEVYKNKEDFVEKGRDLVERAVPFIPGIKEGCAWLCIYNPIRDIKDLFVIPVSSMTDSFAYLDCQKKKESFSLLGTLNLPDWYTNAFNEAFDMRSPGLQEFIKFISIPYAIMAGIDRNPHLWIELGIIMENLQGENLNRLKTIFADIEVSKSKDFYKGKWLVAMSSIQTDQDLILNFK